MRGQFGKTMAIFTALPQAGANSVSGRDGGLAINMEKAVAVDPRTEERSRS